MPSSVVIIDVSFSTLDYIPCFMTILSSFLETVATDAARIIPIGNHISVFIPTLEPEKEGKFVNAAMQTSPAVHLSTLTIGCRLREMADRFENQFNQVSCTVTSPRSTKSLTELQIQKVLEFVALIVRKVFTCWLIQ